MFDNEILKLKNKIGKQEKILLLDNPINNKKPLSLIEKKVIFFSSFLMLISLLVVLIELFKFNDSKFTDITETKYTQNKAEEKKIKNQINLNKIYQKLSISKKITQIAQQQKSQDILHNNLINQIYLQKVVFLNTEIQSLKQIINKIKNEKREILDEYNILSTKNILLNRTSKKEIVRLEENLAALSSKTKIQNHKLSTALSMIDNLQLERINLLSKLNLPNQNEKKLAKFKQ
tara:strand:+ start:115 stop:813 length:699 start_codon:yes stop_codon:yes gene_type:complete